MEDAAAGRWSWRAPVVVILAVLVATAVSVAVVGGWSRTTLIDTDGYVDALVAPLTTDPAVKDAVATELAGQMTRDTGETFAERLKRWVPASNAIARAALDQFGAEIENGWRQQVRPAIRAQLDQPSFNALWIESNAEAHRQLMRALRDSSTGARVTLDLHAIAQDAVREAGQELDRQLQLPGNVMSVVYAAIAAGLPAEVGRISVDVSRVSGPARQAITFVDPVIGFAIGVAVIVTLMALGAAPGRRRGTALAIVGVVVVVAAGVLWLGMSSQTDTVGDRAARMAVNPVSEEMRFVLAREAGLAAASFRPWALGMAAAGGMLVLVGLVWRLASGSRSDPYADDADYGYDTGTYAAYDDRSYQPTSAWTDDVPDPRWSSRGY